MKTTLELPDELMRAIKVRAARSNRRLKDVVAELLEKGMSSPVTAPLSQGGAAGAEQVEISSETGLPLIRSPVDAPIARLSTEEVYALMHRAEQEEDLESVRRGFESR